MMFIFYPIFYPSQNMPVKTQITDVLIVSFFSSLIYYAGLLPFLVMLFSNPFWRKRFEAVTGIQTKIETVVAIQSIFDVFSILRPIQYRNVNLYWRLSRCLDQVNM
jgi:hypothetical protein